MNSIITFLVFYIVVQLLFVTLTYYPFINVHILLLAFGLLFVILLTLVDKTMNYEGEEGFIEPENVDFQPSLRSVCKGGAYMWQEDTPLAKACRDMYADPNLEKTIRNPPGSFMMGAKPYADFQFTPTLSDTFEFMRCSS